MARSDNLYISELASRLRPVFEKHQVLLAIVFGSFARGESSRRSDTDLIIVQHTEKPFLQRYENILCEITHKTPGRDVDLLIYTPEEFEHKAQQRWLSGVLKEGKVIYESE